MKVSVSLPDEDVEFLDGYAKSQGIESRSAAVHQAIRLLHATVLGPSYELAWAEWAEHDDSKLWDPVLGDGLSE